MRRSFRRTLFFAGLGCVSWVLASDQNRVAVASDTPESLLVRTLDAIRAERLDLALERSDSLVTRQPNFRLAQLVRGDILLAQNGRLDKFAGPRSKDPKAQALQDEARVRLGRYVQTPPKNKIPRFLLQPPQDASTVLVVDSRASRMFVFRKKDGQWSLDGDHYVSIGLNGPLKSSEGDQRTPLGVYTMVSRIDKAQLDPYYGNVAYPLDYPNDWDRRLGRKGHGIWVHGTPRDTYSRPPRASNGCVVLPNQDIDTLQKLFELGRTPVLLADSIEWVDPAQADSTRQVLLRAVRKWTEDWSSNDMDRYLSHYSDDFRMGDQDLEGWEKDKRRVAAGKSWVKVAVSGVTMLMVPGEKDLAVVEFDQDYQSSNLSNQMRKRQYWRLEDGSWKIVHEGPAGKSG
ncbi:MAG TPA: L,D-transpeptidase family protein [Fibrobacteria bacterium]|nr:L,D-transpeptidase family protein [Fibrobacteria bacterium]HOX51207.1 L,D-transpeptidase family protein [Fibrobacteria bacterium]